MRRHCYWIAQLYGVARPLASEDRLRLRQMQSKPVLDKLRKLSIGDADGSVADRGGR